MRITAEMKVRDALKVSERMLEAFVWLGPEFERLRNPALRRVMAGRVNVTQAARIGRVPLTEALYVLNLAAGQDPDELITELEAMRAGDFAYQPTNPPRKPRQLVGLSDDDPRVRFVDLMPHARNECDPLPAIMHSLKELRAADDVLLVRHPFDPVPLRDLLARRGFASWAEERAPDEWFIYFYRPAALAAAVAHRPLTVAMFVRAVAAGG